MELEHVWSGADKHTYLCIPPIDPGRMKTCIPDRLDPTVPKANYSRERRIVLDALASRPSWKTKDLARELDLSYMMVSGFISHWINSGTIARVGLGEYRLVRRTA